MTWILGGGSSYVHDIEISKNGRIYEVDMGEDKVIELDVYTNELREWSFPPNNLPLGGVFYA